MPRRMTVRGGNETFSQHATAFGYMCVSGLSKQTYVAEGCRAHITTVRG